MRAQRARNPLVELKTSVFFRNWIPSFNQTIVILRLRNR